MATEGKSAYAVEAAAVTYSVKGKTIDQLVADLEDNKAQGDVGEGAYELVAAALQAEATKAIVRWAQISALAACASAFVAVAALVVAIANG
jgi:hypothetical protein